ncbi:autophagy protein 5 [Heterostelium album PN500]|uniref:Autophagy protein 5 n=1 Tax=Heterostelium pallidum (strain ATCC 26659 / Pp 5 / PN500) TaxID=670386 RepID=D3B8P8_HETP5|nr:autophagy protein 5 [Heterostelium album PN500]EFA82416.1 autophagy protein 5 [Heterostelium album PN500]|eukprot:XP_020434533.1 autophagy protein 5 [Heterostelium album PN500]
MSFFDEDVKKSIWEGKIPIMFTLSPNDLTSHIPPSSLSFVIVMMMMMMMLTFANQKTKKMFVPRNSYFPLITGVVKDHFSYSTLVISDSELWLEYKGIPLKWHIPIGVLFDMLVATPDTTASQIWNITVHFQSFPEKVLLRCSNEDAIRTYYKNVLKEANYIKQGDINKLNNLSINQTNELWDGLKLHDYEKFWSINKMFYPGNGYKHIPYRIIQNNKAPLQDLISPINENGQETTLESLFSKIAFNNSNNSSSNNNNNNNNSNNNSNNNNNIDTSNETQQSTTTLSSSSTNSTTLLQVLNSGSIRYSIQGIEPPLNSSLIWLGDYFSHPDNFLYIVLA